MATKSGNPAYTPARGDVVWLSFDPQAGHEQAGRRPAVVLSPIGYNRMSGLALCVPVTSRIKGYPFEVSLPDGFPVSGAALADQVRSVDWRARDARFITKLPPETVRTILSTAVLVLGEE